METFGVEAVELVIFGVMGVLGWLWKTQSSDIRQTATDLNKLSIKFAETKGGAEATNKTLFSHIEEMKESIQRVENLLLARGEKKNAG